MSFLASITELCGLASSIELQTFTRALPDGDEHDYYLAGPVRLPLHAGHRHASFQWYVGGQVPEQRLFDRLCEGPLTYAHYLELTASLTASSVLLMEGDSGVTPLVRIHSCCTTGDLFGSERCDCGDQLSGALAAIVARGCGMLVYEAAHEGRGIGLLGKMLAYSLQEEGADTYAANDRLGFLDDHRHFEFAAAIVTAFYPDRDVELLTNNPAKLDFLGRVVRNIERVPLHGRVTPANARYIQAKRAKGHLLSLEPDRGLASESLSG